MKRTTLFVAIASALSLSVPAYAWNKSSQNESGQGQSSRSSASEQSTSGQQSQSPGMVKQAQEKLSDMGKDVGGADGKLGPKTQQALKDFQQEKGLQPSGQLDQDTIAALDLGQSGSAASGG